MLESVHHLETPIIEPLPSESLLWDMKNVSIYHHSASTNDRENERIVALFYENLHEEGIRVRFSLCCTVLPHLENTVWDTKTLTVDSFSNLEQGFDTP